MAIQQFHLYSYVSDIVEKIENGEKNPDLSKLNFSDPATVFLLQHAHWETKIVEVDSEFEHQVTFPVLYEGGFDIWVLEDIKFVEKNELTTTYGNHSSPIVSFSPGEGNYAHLLPPNFEMKFFKGNVVLRAVYSNL